MSEKALPVIIRYEGKGRATRHDWHVSDLVAVFPTEPGTNDPYTMACYSTVGEHSSCTSSFLTLRTKKATKEQVEAMLRALRNYAGGGHYDNLKVVQRTTKYHLAERKKMLGVR